MKLCRGHFHAPGTLLPLDRFYVHRSGERQGKPFSECKQCWSYRRNRGGEGKGEPVPIERFLPIVSELFQRIGQTNTARRIGVAVDTISRNRLSKKTSIRLSTFQAASKLLEEVRQSGENGWDTKKARISNFTAEARKLAGQRAAQTRSRRAKAREWQIEMARDLGLSDSAWARPDKDGNLHPFADFECEHGRLPHDQTPPCGCWPNEV